MFTEAERMWIDGNKVRWLITFFNTSDPDVPHKTRSILLSIHEIKYVSLQLIHAYPDDEKWITRSPFSWRQICDPCFEWLWNSAGSNFARLGCSFLFILRENVQSMLVSIKKTIYDSWKFAYISCYHIYPTPPLGQDMTQGQFFNRSLTGLNSEFSFF